MNTTDFLSIASAICPDRDGIVFGGERWTYSDLNERVNRLCNAMTKLGLSKGDRVGVLNVNCNQYVETYFASAKLGAIFVPLNFRAKADELTYLINHAEIRTLFIGERYLGLVKKILPDTPVVKDCIAIDCREGLFYEDLISSGSSEDYLVEIEDEDVTILMYTSGTTGKPKCVPLTHNAFAGYLLENVDPADPEQDERNILTVPLYHVAGIQAMLAAVYGGRTLLMMKQFEEAEWLEMIQREKASRAMLVPTMLKRILDAPDFEKYDLSSLKVITYGAAAMPFEVVTKAIEVMPWVRFFNAFGQTETASTITVLGPDDHMIEGTNEEKEKKLQRLRLSIGKPLPDVEVKIVNEEGSAVPAFELGEILVRGPRVMKGYWGDQEKASGKITEDGWLRTGDMGYMDEEGYIFLSGRADDMIIRGGENISPEEVEDVLHSHPKVQEASIIGVPDLEWGQQPRAVVVLKKGESESPEGIIEFCKPRLAGFKRPRSVVFADALPRNPVGKVLRKRLRELYGEP